MTIAVVVPAADKFVSVINGSIFGTSRHIDYWEHHFKLQDLKTLNALGVTLFVHTDTAGAVTECIEAEALSKGKSYKTADRAKEPLTAVELKLVADAFVLATPRADINKPAADSQQSAATVPAVSTVAPAPAPTVATVTAPANDTLAVASAMGPASKKKARKAK